MYFLNAYYSYKIPFYMVRLWHSYLLYLCHNSPMLKVLIIIIRVIIITGDLV